MNVLPRFKPPSDSLFHDEPMFADHSSIRETNSDIRLSELFVASDNVNPFRHTDTIAGFCQ
jgi:hypothetical protein